MGEDSVKKIEIKLFALEHLLAALLEAIANQDLMAREEIAGIFKKLEEQHKKAPGNPNPTVANQAVPIWSGMRQALFKTQGKAKRP